MTTIHAAIQTLFDFDPWFAGFLIYICIMAAAWAVYTAIERAYWWVRGYDGDIAKRR